MAEANDTAVFEFHISTDDDGKGFYTTVDVDEDDAKTYIELADAAEEKAHARGVVRYGERDDLQVLSV